jgi:hypothetical protein
MKTRSTMISVSLLLCALAAYAAEPAAPTSTSTAATPAQNAATQAAAAPKPTLTTTEETAKQAKTLGLAPKVYNGKLMWCKSDAALGTKIPSYNCIRDDQVAAAAQLARQNKDTVDQMQRNNLSQPPAKEPTMQAIGH